MSTQKERTELLAFGYVNKVYNGSIPTQLIALIQLFYNDWIYWILKDEQLNQFRNAQPDQEIISPKSFNIKGIQFVSFSFPNGFEGECDGLVLIGIKIKYFPPNVEYCEFYQEIEFDHETLFRRVRLKSRKRGFFQKKRSYKPSPQENALELINPVPPPAYYNDTLPVPPPAYYDNDYGGRNNYNYNYDYEQTEDEDEYSAGDVYGGGGGGGINNNGVSDEDKMRNICDKLGIRKGIHIGVNLYGFINHLTVYEEIYRLAQIEHENQRNDIIKSYNSNKLRDIKSKIQSSGKTGKKNEMIHGICKKLLEYRKNYEQNETKYNYNNDSTNENDTIEHKTNNINNTIPPAMDTIVFQPPIIQQVEIQPPIIQQVEEEQQPIDMTLITLVQRYTGSGGINKCDGCGMTMETYKSYEGLEDTNNNSDDNNNNLLLDGFIKDICPNCKYGVCEYCQAHNSRGTCYCTNSNFGNVYHEDESKREWHQGGKVTIQERNKAIKMMQKMEDK